MPSLVYVVGYVGNDGERSCDRALKAFVDHAPAQTFFDKLQRSLQSLPSGGYVEVDNVRVNWYANSQPYILELELQTDVGDIDEAYNNTLAQRIIDTKKLDSVGAWVQLQRVCQSEALSGKTESIRKAASTGVNVAQANVKRLQKSQ